MQEFSTRLFFPSWWVRAFENVSVLDFENLPVFDQVVKTGISPTLGPHDLNPLSMIVSSFQKQLLESNLKLLTVSPSEFQKQVNLPNKQRPLSYMKMLQSLLGIKFIGPTEQGFSLLPLVATERWTTPKQGGDIEWQLSLSDMGADLLLGYTNPHLELVRQVSNLASAVEVLGEDKPLSVWKSAWFDLQGVEQSLLIRIEKAMQWEYAWLHFDGIFGKNLFSLLENLPLSLSDAKWQSHLERFGKKLHQHGLLKFAVEDEFLALSKEEKQSMLLVWQVSHDKAFSTVNDDYQKKACKYLVTQSLNEKINTLIRLISADSYNSSLQMSAAEMWRTLIASAEDKSYDGIALDRASCPLTSLPLFVEWAIRQEPMSKFPLPEVFQRTPLARLARLTSEIPVQERFQNFQDMLTENQEWREHFKKLEGATLVSSRSLQTEEIGSYIRNVKTNGFASRVSMPVRPPAPPPPNVPNPISAQVKEEIEKKPFSQQNIKVMAAEELKRMMVTDKLKFAELKKKFFESLDATKKKLILDVQGRMEPTLFDNHLKHSLIKFMIDNPAVWKGASGGSRPSSISSAWPLN